MTLAVEIGLGIPANFPPKFIPRIEQPRREHVRCFLFLFDISSVDWIRMTGDGELRSTIPSPYPTRTATDIALPGHEEVAGPLKLMRPVSAGREGALLGVYQNNRARREHRIQSEVAFCLASTNLSGAYPRRRCGGGNVFPMMGLSYEKEAISYAYFHASNHNLIALFRRLGDGVLRIGGGSVDQIVWTPDSEAATHAQVSPANIKTLAGFLQATGWQCLNGVNLATSTPALAAAEVAYAVSELGSSLLGIAIVNESDEHGEEGSFSPGDQTFRDFLKRWDSFRSAIIRAAPDVPITGPDTGGGNHIYDWTFPQVQAVTPSEITLMTQHYYRASGASTTSIACFLISPDPRLTG